MNTAAHSMLLALLLGTSAAEGVAPLPKAPPLANFVATAAEPNDRCLAISSKWPAIVGRVEAAFRARNQADFAAGHRRLVAWLDAQAPAGCPPWPEALAIQRALLNEFPSLFAISHAADAVPAQVAGRDTAQVVEEYQKLNDEACVRASTRMQTAWRVFQEQGKNTAEPRRRQRFVTNLQTDASVVQRTGSLGAPLLKSANFVGLAHTEVLSGLEGQLDCLQGQGPYGHKAAQDYVLAANQYARDHAIARTVFVNVAGGQVPGFAEQVKASSAATEVQASYVQFDGWKDGTVVTPKQVADFVQKLSQQALDPHKKTLLVVNCNAGMDRSGTVNALTQLVLATQKDLAAGLPVAQAVERGFAAIPKVVWQLKQARPHAISSAGRYVFLYQSYAAYAESLRP